MKLNALDLNKLFVFCSVVENRGYKGASEQIGLTRSAISQAITTLEAQLKHPLFHRTGTKLIPTEEALRFYNEVRRYQSGLESALELLHAKEYAETGLLKVGAYLEFTKTKLMPLIETFLTNHPQIKIQFHFDSPTRLDQMLEKGRIDLAISIYQNPSRRVLSQKLFEEELCLVGRKDLIDLKPSADELTRIPVIDYFPSHQIIKRWWKLHFPKKVFRSSTRVYAATAEIVLDMVIRRLGVGVVPKYLLQDKDLLERVHVIEPTARKLIDHMWINRRKDKTNNKIEELFLRHLKSEF